MNKEENHRIPRAFGGRIGQRRRFRTHPGHREALEMKGVSLRTRTVEGTASRLRTETGIVVFQQGMKARCHRQRERPALRDIIAHAAFGTGTCHLVHDPVQASATIFGDARQGTLKRRE
jgi:hypothetical protein